MRASSTTFSTAAMLRPFACTVTLDSAWNPAARTTGQSRCRNATFSRQVSMPMRRIASVALVMSLLR